MVKRILFLILAVCTLSAVAREQIPLTSWKFHFGDVPGAVQIGFDDSGWKRVRVPHDWAIDQPFDMRIDMQSIQVLEDGDKAPKMRTGRTGALPGIRNRILSYGSCFRSFDDWQEDTCGV